MSSGVAKEVIVAVKSMDEADILKRAEKLTRLTPQQIEKELLLTGFLDPTMGICEGFFVRDPILAVLENPLMKVVVPRQPAPVPLGGSDPTATTTTTTAAAACSGLPREDEEEDEEETVTLIDALLQAAHLACSRAYGPKYDEFALIQSTMQTLLHSTNTHAKQFTFLCLLAIEPGLQDALRNRYPKDENAREVNRLEPFIATVRKNLDKTLNMPYVPNAVPNQYNAEHLIRQFLQMLVDEYRY